MIKSPEYLFVISFDGLATLDFDYISKLPGFKRYLSTAAYCKKVYSVYPSLTYPAHATIVTGKYPKKHGIVNNTLLQPNRKSPDWFWQRSYIKGDTLYDLAINKGKKVAALLWPTTAKSRIQYNLPEIFANRPWTNQILVSLFNGSPLYQINLNNKFGHLRKGLTQPYLDNFIHESLLYTIKNKKPDLTFVHYTDLDSMRHYHGFNSPEAKEALNRLDKRLGEILDTVKESGIYDKSTIVVLGDHSSLDEDKVINLNVLLHKHGYIQTDENKNISSYKAIVKNCDGSAYVYVKGKDKAVTHEVQKLISQFNNEKSCIDNVYTSAEAAEFGADPDCALILEARLGYYFQDEIEGDIIVDINKSRKLAYPHYTKATHGYSPFKPDYTTVFMASGCGIRKNTVIPEMNLVDEAPTLARLLGLKLKDADGKVIEEFLKA